MTQKNRSAGEQTAGERGASARKPYKKPEFRYEKVFETMALACGKVHPTQAQCRFNRKRS